jgi:hypothetical protein
MSDLAHQNLATVQSSLQPGPQTLVSATTVAPTTFITFVTDSVQIATITPPVTGQHMLIMIHTDAAPATYLTTGNILTAVVPTKDLPSFFFYDPNQKKYYGCASNVT